MNKVALIANFTGFSGHFGMYATSLAIVEQLLAKGYDIDLIGVDQLRHLAPTKMRQLCWKRYEVRLAVRT